MSDGGTAGAVVTPSKQQQQQQHRVTFLSDSVSTLNKTGAGPEREFQELPKSTGRVGIILVAVFPADYGNGWEDASSRNGSSGTSARSGVDFGELGFHLTFKTRTTSKKAQTFAANFSRFHHLAHSQFLEKKISRLYGEKNH